MKEIICPHCNTRMESIETPMESSWGGEIHYVCFNDKCPYFERSWENLFNQGVQGVGYRCRIDARGACGPIPITSPSDLHDLIIREVPPSKGTLDFFGAADFARDDETPDPDFYSKPRLVDHLDSLALSTVEDLYARFIKPGDHVLDLMSGPDSHIKPELAPGRVVGLGLNEEELTANPILTERIIHDLNADPKLPFPDDTFDAVLNTVSVDYLTRPVEVFQEAARVLKPKGVLAVVFSNRMFPPKAVNIWKYASESERVDFVKKLFSLAELFYLEGAFESKGKPRPVDDKYYSLGIPSDPIYAVWGRVVK